jgi:hypothetical protein
MDQIKDIIPQVISDLSQRKPHRQIQIQNIWQEIIDEKTRKHVAIAGFDRGRLLVWVDSSTWLFQLNLNKKKILGKIQKQVSEVESIQFKIGKLK